MKTILYFSFYTKLKVFFINLFGYFEDIKYRVVTNDVHDFKCTKRLVLFIVQKIRYLQLKKDSSNSGSNFSESILVTPAFWQWWCTQFILYLSPREQITRDDVWKSALSFSCTIIYHLV